MREINSVSNNLIVETAKLKNKKYRVERGLFLVEGYHLIEEAMKHQLLEMVFSTDKDYLEKLDLENKYLVSETVLKKLCDTVNPQGIIGAVNFAKQSTLKELLNDGSSHFVLLDDVADPGNLGTIIRTAAAFGYDAVIGSNNTVDFYNDKTVRSSQGTIFKINLLKGDLLEIIPMLKENGFVVFGSSLQSSLPIEEVEKPTKCAIVLGNEAHGMCKDVESMTSQNIILPMKKDVESLNVSVASAILMWEFKR